MSEDNSVPWLSGITDDNARRLIESDSPIIRVVAGPGSGKTTCLERRIQRLIKKDRVDPKKVFVGTFTRAITKELRDKLDPQIKVSTIHSLAFELLREYPAACQGMQLRFLLQYEEDVLLYDIKDAVPNVGSIHDYRKELKNLQASRSKREEVPNARFGEAVRRWLRRHRAMLIGETVYLCVVGLESKDIQSKLYDYVVIDEYQDLTAAEQELVQYIWSETGALTVMGDDDQSIYGFRFNHPGGIQEFHTSWPQCEDLTLANNYRCGECILHISNLMMAEANSAKQPMVLKNNYAGKLNAVHWDTLDDEIAGLAKHIRDHAQESFLVLVPRRFIGYRLAEAIGADASTAFTEEILEHPVAQESFATASLLADPEDFVAARTYLSYHGTKHEYASRRNADAYSKIPTDVGGHDLIYGIANGKISVSGHGKSHIKGRAAKAVELFQRSLTADEIIDISFKEELAESESNEEKRRWLIDDLQELRSTAHELLDLQDHPDLSKVMATLRHRIATRVPLRDSELAEPRVKIMTLHSAKGLEADNIIISGVADEILPGIVTDQEDYEEKRRLLYVAVTRARDSLIISWPRRIQLNDLATNAGRRNGNIVTYNGVR
ncbi:MAG: ATP-dependent helicase, partial [Cenarchaeum sp. SB0669_bin_11]|nr:ATP-dependent helicase [Cenarchaeum sp. SB0669_bin_11]